MRLLKKSVGEGFLHLQADSLDDLWTLRTLIQPNDKVTADTFRTAESTGDKLRESKMEKRPVRLTVKAESVEWHHFDDHLRVLGPIEAGTMDTGRHHTLIIRPDGSDLQIQKRGPLQPWHSRIVEEAVASSQAPQILVVAIDDTEAQFANLKSYGIQMLGALSSPGQGKRFAGAADAKKAFYEMVRESLRLFRAPDIPLVVVGPGWWREELIAHVKEKEPALVKGVQTEGTSQGGRAGIHEAVRRGLLERVGHDHRVGRETQLVERVLLEISRGGPVAYGDAEVQAAVAKGAAETVLASDERVRSGSLDELLRSAEEARARVLIVSGGHDAGARLHQLGGIAALLRYA